MTTAQSKPLHEPTRSYPIEIVSDSLAFGVAFAVLLTIVQRGIGFLRGVVFCRIMTDQELGQWSMVFSFLMLLAPFAVLGLPGSFGRFAEHFLQRGQFTVFVRRITGISGVLTLMLAVSMFLFPGVYSQLIFRSSIQQGVIHAMGFALVFVAANNFLCSLMEALRQVRLTTWMRFLTGLTFAVAGISLIAVWQDGARAATFGFGIACFVGLMPGLWFLWTHRKSLTDFGESLPHSQMWKRIAPFAIWLWAANLVNNMFEVADRYMLIHWSQVPAELAHGFVGQYHSGRVLPLLLVGIGIVLEGLLMPYMTVLWEQGKRRETGEQVATAMKLTAIAFTAAGLLILVGAPLLFDGVLAGRYAGGLEVLPLTLVYCIWLSMFTIGQTYLWVAEKGKYAFAITAAGLALNLVLNGLLIPVYGLWGAVIATSTATLACLLLTLAGNWIAGYRADRGVLISGLVPLVILLPVSGSLAAAVVLIIVATKTELLFAAPEKRLISSRIQELIRKLKPA